MLIHTRCIFMQTFDRTFNYEFRLSWKPFLDLGQTFCQYYLEASTSRSWVHRQRLTHYLCVCQLYWLHILILWYLYRNMYLKREKFFSKRKAPIMTLAAFCCCCLIVFSLRRFIKDETGPPSTCRSKRYRKNHHKNRKYRMNQLSNDALKTELIVGKVYFWLLTSLEFYF